MKLDARPGATLALAISGMAILIVPWLGRANRGNWVWGLNAWSYQPPWAAGAALAVGLLVLGGTAWLALRGGSAARPDATPSAPTGPATRGKAATSKSSGPLPSGRFVEIAIARLPILICLLVPVLLWAFRESIHFLGDTHIRLDAIARVAQGRPLSGVLLRSRAAPLDEVGVIYGGGRLAKFLGVDPLVMGQLIPCLFGLVFAIAAARIARHWEGRSREALLPLALLLTQGYMQLFAGYQETYGAQLVLLALWYGCILGSDGKGDLPISSHVFLGLACLAHRDSVLILPAHFVAWRAARAASGATAAGAAKTASKSAGQKIPPATRRSRTWLAAGILAICLAILGLFWGRQLGEDWAFLGNPGPPGPGAYPLLSWLHASHILNNLFLLAPAGILAVALVLRAPASVRAHGPLLLAAAPFWILAALVRSNFHGLGPIRDWDALAPAGFFLALLAARLLTDAVRAAPRTRPLAWACVFACLLYTSAWVELNARESSSLERAVATTYGEPGIPAAPASLAFDALGRLHQDRGQFELAAHDYLAAAGQEDSPRFRWAAGGNLWASGREKDAFEQFVIAARNPAFREERAAILIRDLRESPGAPMLNAMREALFRAEAESAGGTAGAAP